MMIRQWKKEERETKEKEGQRDGKGKREKRKKRRGGSTVATVALWGGGCMPVLVPTSNFP
jgi:hypothetical protein